MKKIDETIENICSWINDRLNDSMTLDETYATAGMVTALANLVSTRADLAIEKRVADLEGQVQSQQSVNTEVIVKGISYHLREGFQGLNT